MLKTRRKISVDIRIFLQRVCVCVCVLAAEQRRSNESLDGVSGVVELSRRVINESTTLQSDLETIESDALEALQRTTRQYSAVIALSQVIPALADTSQ